MSKRKTPEDYHKLAENKGFKWVGIYTGHVRDKTKWQCSKEHTWFAPYDLIRQGKGCPHCAGNARKMPDDYHKLAAERGIEWIGPPVNNARTPTNWRCAKGHIWATAHDMIHRGAGCPYCAGVAKKTKKDYHLLAQSREIKWIGNDLPPNTNIETKWQCSEGHIWFARYGSIFQGGGCPYCSGKATKTAADYHALANARKHEWIANDIPKDIHTVTTWRCERGHIRETCYNNVKKFGCPKCLDMVNGVQVSKPQRQLCEIVRGELNRICGRYRIDIALPDEKIAIEYDSWFWHGHKQELDTKRDKYLFARGWKILRVKSDNQVPSQHQIESAIAQLMGGKKKVEIILDDWGQGDTFADIEMVPKERFPYIQLELF